MSDLISIAASDGLAESMITRNTPYTLDPDILSRYNKMFFPSKENAKELRLLFPAMFKLSANINAFYGFARYILFNGALLEDMDDSSREEFIQSALTRSMQQLSVPDFESIAEVMDDARLSTGLVITPSKLKSGGFAVTHEHVPGKVACILKSMTDASLSTDKRSPMYAEERLSSYSTELSLKVVEACKVISKELFGADYTIENAHKRVRAQLPLDFNFTRLNAVFKSITGISINFFENLPAKFSTRYKSHVHFLFIIEPNKNVFFAWRNYVKSHEETKTKPDNSTFVSEESQWCGQRVASSFALHLSKEEVQYICQDAEMTRPYYSLTILFSRWLSYFLCRPNLRGAGGSDKALAALPRMVIPMQSLAEMQKARKENGLHVSKSRTNEDGIVIDPVGRICFMPNSDQLDLSTALEYEKNLDDLLGSSYSAGAPNNGSLDTLNSDAYSIWAEDPNLDKKILDKKKQVNLYHGALLATDWDFNSVFSVGGEGGIAYRDLNGAVAPDDLVIADMLGFDFKEEGEDDQAKTFDHWLTEFGYTRDMSNTTVATANAKTILTYVGSAQANPDFRAANLMTSRRFLKLFEVYSYYSIQKKVPSIHQLLSATKIEMGITDLKQVPLDSHIYTNTISDSCELNGGLLGGMGNTVEEGHIVLALLISALRDSRGMYGSNLSRIIIEEVGTANVRTELKGHPSHFDLTKESRLADFGNVYTYFGGRVFKNMCAAITQIDRKEMMYPKRSITDEKVGLLPSFDSISNDIIPLSVIFSKYVPNYLDYFEKAEAIYEKNQMDDSIDIDDIIAPGVAQGSQVFPHQVKAHKFLRKRPKYAVLDVHPGGGKTIMGLLDIMCLAHELKGQYFRPLVLAPDKICRNWCDDLSKISGGSWNSIALTGATLAEWGAERLIELINNSPRNTLIVASINFLKTKRFTVSIGPKQLQVSGGIEFVKQFSPNYVLLDESHKAKTFDPPQKVSQVHNAIKNIFTMDGIEFARLATGTLVHGVVADVIGQAALFTAYSFKTKNTTDIDITDSDAPLKMRSKLGKYASVITLKRKEWAFMLPNPIDTFIATQLTDGGKPGNLLHAEVYQTVMKETMDKLKAEVARIKKGGKSKDDDEDDDDDPDDEGTSRDGDLDDVMGDDDELAALGTIRMQKYLQSVEQLVTDPWGDVSFQDAAEAAGVRKGDFTPSKIAAVEQRLDVHFNIVPYDPQSSLKARIVRWEKGMVPLEFDVVEHKGVFYMRRLMPTDDLVGLERKTCPPSLIEPDKDQDIWKIEKRGKVIIFCRYTRCVNAIFEGLPERYKSRAKKFHGKLGQIGEDKWKNLDAFATNSDVDIMIANEQAISEGHNLQMGSRNIRVDTPWSPGELDQSAARIFRPDPSAAKVENGKKGDMAREVIYTDWIMTEGTTEVAKVARLMWKSVAKVKFDEKGNPRYDPLMEVDLEPIPMNLEFLSTRNTMDDFREDGNDYFGAKQLLSNIERQEFAEMRQSTNASMQDLSVPEIPADYTKLDQYPILDGQTIPDPMGFGYERFTEWVRNTPNFSENLEEHLYLCPVKTGFGTGVIVGYNRSYIIDKDGNKVPDPDRPITSAKVRYKSNDELVSHKIGNIFVARKVGAEDLDRFFNTDMPWGTETQRDQIEKAADREARKIAKANQEREEKNREAKSTGEQAARTEDRKRIRRANEISGRPINDTVETVVRIPRVKNNVGQVTIDRVGDFDKPKTDMKLKIIPSVYNGFISIHATNNDKDTAALKKYEFIPHENFIYIDFKNYKNLDAFITWVEKKYVLDRATEKRIETIIDTFEDTGRMGFNARLASKVQSELANFFRTRKRESLDRKSLKIYPSVLHDRVRLMVDLATNPVAKRLIGVAVPNAGATAIWKEHPGMSVFFAANRRAALGKLKEITKAGYTITNLEKVTAAITNLKLK